MAKTTSGNIAHNRQCDDSERCSVLLCPSVVHITECIFSYQLDCFAPQVGDMFSRHSNV